MNVPDLIDQHETAIDKLREIGRLEKMRNSLIQDSKGIAGAHFPDKKAEWLKSAERYQERINDAMVDYRIFTRNLK